MPGHAVLIQPLEDSGKLVDPLLGGFQLLFLAVFLRRLSAGWAAYKLCYVLRCVAGYAPQVFNHFGGQVVDALLVAVVDVAILFLLLRLVSLLIHDAAAIPAKKQAGEQAHLVIAVRAFALLA